MEHMFAEASAGPDSSDDSSGQALEPAGARVNGGGGVRFQGRRDPMAVERQKHHGGRKQGRQVVGEK